MRITSFLFILFLASCSTISQSEKSAYYIQAETSKCAQEKMQTDSGKFKTNRPENNQTKSHERKESYGYMLFSSIYWLYIYKLIFKF